MEAFADQDSSLFRPAVLLNLINIRDVGVRTNLKTMARKANKSTYKKSLASINPATIADSCDGVVTVALNGNGNLVSDEDSSLPLNLTLKKTSLEQIKTGEASTPGEKVKKFACKHNGCPFITAYSKDLKRHSRIHSGERPFQCKVCQRRFYRSDKLKVHEKLHTDFKTLCCTKCEYTTRYSRQFEKHMRGHLDDVSIRSKCPTLTGECQYFVVDINPDSVPLLSLPSDDKVDTTAPQLSTDSGSVDGAKIETRTSIVKTNNTDGESSGKLKKFACDFLDCHFISAYKKDLTRHMRIHSGELPFECVLCKKRFNRSDKLKIHERSHSGEKYNAPKLKKFACHLHNCDYASAYRKDLRRHMRVHSGEHPFQCEICKRKFKRSDTLKLHVRSHITDGNAAAECNNLKKSTDISSDDSSSSVSLQPDSHSPVPCDTSQKMECNDENALVPDDTKAVERVMATAGGSNLIQNGTSEWGSSRPYFCYHAGCRFASECREGLAEHLQVHSVGYATPSGRNLRKQARSNSVEIHHGINSVTITPIFCDKPKENKWNDEPKSPNNILQTSVNSKPVKRPATVKKRIPKPRKEDRGSFEKSKKYACDYTGCPFISAYKKDLVRHSRVHSGEKPYECGICHRKFNRSDKLRLHERTHSGDKPYKCDKCKYAAAEGSALRIHMSKHSEEKPFRCQKCPYACRYSRQLAVHVKTHTEEILYSCQSCNCKFNASTDLEQHELLHVANKSSECAENDSTSILKGNMMMRLGLKQSSKQKCSPCPHPECSFTGKSRQALGLHFFNHHKRKLPDQEN